MEKHRIIEGVAAFAIIAGGAGVAAAQTEVAFVPVVPEQQAMPVGFIKKDEPMPGTNGQLFDGPNPTRYLNREHRRALKKPQSQNSRTDFSRNNQRIQRGFTGPGTVWYR